MLRKRWFRRGLITFVVCVVILLAFDQVDRYLTRRTGEKRYAEIVAHLDATDPRWRYDELDADRGQLPDDQNGALLVPKFTAAMAKPSFAMDKRLEAANYSEVPPNHVLADDTYDAIDEILAANTEALAIARKFADYPRGLRRYALAPNPIDTRLPDTNNMRLVFRLLDLAAERAGRDGRGETALGYIRPLVNGERSLDGEPSYIAALVRMAGLRTCVARVERTLALATPRSHLPDVQALLTQEGEADLFWYGVRGERAFEDVLFTRIRDGSLSLLDISGKRSGIDALDARFGAWLYDPHMANDHATFLEMMTRVYAARSLPEHQQRSALQSLDREFGALTRGAYDSLLTRALTPAFMKVHDASLRAKARLRCAAVGLAVERFRLAHGRWPANLAEIPRTLLPAIPIDPFNGWDLRYVKRADGVTVYSVGPDGQDDGGTAHSGKETNDPGQDVVFRLYDPARRGLPAQPKPGSMSVWADPAELDRFDGAPPELGPDPRELDGVGRPQ